MYMSKRCAESNASRCTVKISEIHQMLQNLAPKVRVYLLARVKHNINVKLEYRPKLRTAIEEVVQEIFMFVSNTTKDYCTNEGMHFKKYVQPAYDLLNQSIIDLGDKEIFFLNVISPGDKRMYLMSLELDGIK